MEIENIKWDFFPFSVRSTKKSNSKESADVRKQIELEFAPSLVYNLVVWKMDRLSKIEKAGKNE